MKTILRADIWSFGITALELAYGHSPFKSQSPHQVPVLVITDKKDFINFEVLN
jgi:serine/threonine protein kinase